MNEIMLNGDQRFFIERAGTIVKLDCRLPELAIEAAIRAIMVINSKDTAPIMDARLPGLRVACALPPVAVHGPLMTIRKHSRAGIGLDDYVRIGSFDPIAPGADTAPTTSTGATTEQEIAEREAAAGGDGLARFFRYAIRTKKNLLLVGGTSSGKTTFMSACLAEIGDERIITCEDTNELTLTQPNVIQLEAWDAPGVAPVTIRHLIRLCLRCRPDRIIVGEVRGAEAYDLLDAINTGHPGSISTLHADSAVAGLQRLESLVRMSPTATNLPLPDLRAAIAHAIDYVVFLARIGGRRGPVQVIALDGCLEGEYRWHSIFGHN